MSIPAIREMSSIQSNIKTASLGLDLIKACEEGDLQAAASILGSPNANQLEADDLGQSLEYLAKLGGAFPTIRKLCEAKNFQNVRFPQKVHHPYVQIAFIAIVQQDDAECVQFFLNHPQTSQDLSPDYLTLAISTCIEKNFSSTLKTILESELFLKSASKMEKAIPSLLSLTIEKQPFSTLELFLKVPPIKVIFDEKREPLFLLALKTRPPAYIKGLMDHFLSPQPDTLKDESGIEIWKKGQEWRGSLTGQRLMRWIGPKIGPKILCFEEISFAPEDYRILLPETWIQGIDLALSSGNQTALIKSLVQAPFLQEISLSTREELFIRSCSACKKHPQLKSLAKTFVGSHLRPELPGFSWNTVSICMELAAEFDLAEIFGALASMESFQNVSQDLYKRIFIKTALHGHYRTLGKMLEIDRSQEITSDEIVQIFRAYREAQQKQVLFILLEKCKDRISQEHLNEIFSLLVFQCEKDLLSVFLMHIPLEKIDKEHLEKLFSPLISLGERFKPGIDAEKIFKEHYPKLEALRDTINQVASNDLFKLLFARKDSLNFSHSDLSSIFITAAGSGFLSLLANIYHLRRDELNKTTLVLGALQACSDSSFLMIFEKGENDFETKSMPIQPRPKGQILSFLLSDWQTFQNFLSLDFNSRTYPILKRLLFQAAEFGSKEQTELLLKHCLSGQGMGYAKKDRGEARAIALSHKHQEVADLLNGN